MCGLAGYVTLDAGAPVSREVLHRMGEQLVHRGPDSAGQYADGQAGFAFRRLSIIDLAGGDQPIANEDGSIVLVCNGEIFNFRQLRAELEGRGHRFRTRSDVEVIVHLYEDHGPALLQRLNGQFAFAIWDRRRQTLLLARDQAGIAPLFYAATPTALVFGSEIKALLEHPAVPRRVDLVGLDQVLVFPGLVSPRTMFAGVESLKPGHYLLLQDGRAATHEYWDLDYPAAGQEPFRGTEEEAVDRLEELFERAVRLRLQADVPVGAYLSGGLDSSMIAAMATRLSPDVERHTFSISFPGREMCEGKYQRMMASHLGTIHHEVPFGWEEITTRLETMIRHCECPVKESYNTCSMALSQAAREAGVPVVLTGEGADELFAGYVGYRFDGRGERAGGDGLMDAFEDELRERVFGDRALFYERNEYEYQEMRRELYAPGVRDEFDDFNCLNHNPVNPERLRGRHPIHQRSYLDFKLRLGDHLVGDHGDRMCLANSVEARYPFLDPDLIRFAATLPPELKLNGFHEKYALKRVAERLIPREVIEREKFGFHAPGSPFLLRHGPEWVGDLLSPERVRRQGVFDPEVVEALRARYTQEGFRLALPFENDLLMIVLTFGIFLDQFGLSGVN